MSLLRGALQPGLAVVKKTAPFYSAVDEALAAIKRPKGTGAEFYTELTKQAGVKKAELADRKLEQAFKAKGKMIKEEAQQVLADNPPPKLKEKVYDESTAIDEDDLREMVSQEMFGVPYSTIGFSGARHRQISDEVYRRMDADNGTKYGKYRTPDGENYREILLKLPDDKQRFWAKNGQGVERIFSDPDEASRFAGSSGDARAMDDQTVNRMRNQYYSSHWEDEPNVLAHMRVQDRKGPNGERILHVEEIQSDWHQAGRKKGYKPDDYIEQSNALDKEFQDLVNKRGQLRDEAERIGYRGEGHKALVEEANSITPRLMQLQEQRDKMRDVINYGVPDAPFKKNWHELAMKRLLNYAADNGYDSIAITPGAEQAKRYDLSKQISRVVYSPDTGMLNAFDHNNKSVVMHSNVKPDEVADYIGKEPAQRLFDEQNTKLNFKGGKDVPYQEISGIDLQVGGEGMMGFYDKMLPDYLNNFGKPYGAQVGVFDMPNPRKGLSITDVQKEAGITEQQWLDLPSDEKMRLIDEMDVKAKAATMPLHNFPITPEMRESIKQKGLPLYQQVGIPTAGAGAASQMLEPEEEAGLATGGVVKSAVKQAQLAKLAKMRQEMAPRAEAVKALIARDQNRYLADVVPNSLTNAEIESEIKRMAAKAPMIMKPSALTELRKIVQKEKGDYGSRRLERAADEIPNLERLYKQQALKEAFTGDNARGLMTMNPADFEKYSVPLDARFMDENSTRYTTSGERLPYPEYMKGYLPNVGAFNDVPFLLINKEEQGLPLTPFISGHEGRHRNRVMVDKGEKSGLVQLMPRAELREPFPRRSQEEYIDALKQELEMTGNMVTPEEYFDNFTQKKARRLPIILPDVYAKGGAVRKQAGGGVAPYGMRHGTIAPKGKGYFGELKRPDGDSSTELSSEFEYNNQKVEYPLIVPTLSKAELNILLKGERPTDDILNKAESWAKSRIDKGMSPFASSTGNERFPVPTSTDGLAKGGRVKMTENRDTMFMELSNKKLKRK